MTIGATSSTGSEASIVCLGPTTPRANGSSAKDSSSSAEISNEGIYESEVVDVASTVAVSASEAGTDGPTP